MKTRHSLTIHIERTPVGLLPGMARPWNAALGGMDLTLDLEEPGNGSGEEQHFGAFAPVLAPSTTLPTPGCTPSARLHPQPQAVPLAPGCTPSPRLHQLPQAAQGIFLPWGFGLGVRLQGLWEVRQHCPKSGSCGKQNRGHSQQGLRPQTQMWKAQWPLVRTVSTQDQACRQHWVVSRLLDFQPLGIPWGIPTAAVLEASARVPLPSPGDSASC